MTLFERLPELHGITLILYRCCSGRFWSVLEYLQDELPQDLVVLFRWLEEHRISLGHLVLETNGRLLLGNALHRRRFGIPGHGVLGILGPVKFAMKRGESCLVRIRNVQWDLDFACL